MHEIVEGKNRLTSLSLFVGTGKCNAHCVHCAGVPLRKYAPKEDGGIDKDLINKTIKTCYGQGARYLSISSSGEPTLSPLAVTKTLELIHECGKEGIIFNPINIYSNGIRIGEDRNFCEEYLSLWKTLGLTTFYVTVHDINRKKNAYIYGVSSYPSLDLVVFGIHHAGLLMRANLILSKNTISTLNKFVSTIEHLMEIGVDSVSAWPIRNQKDKVDVNLSPLEKELDKMEDWIGKHQIPTFKLKLLREKSKSVYQTGQKLTLFPDGILSNSWCNYLSE